MPIRYYPLFRVKINQITRGKEFFINGKPYVGLYYTTYDGKSFTGPNPNLGPNEELSTVSSYNNTNVGLQNLQDSQGSTKFVTGLSAVTNNANSTQKNIISYFPRPIQSDYNLGYIDRFFVKQQNNSGYITEISPQQYTEIVNGAVGYNVSLLQTLNIRWKLTGPLNAKRISQYDVRAGIIDTNKRLVEQANPNFFGIVDFIGGNYSKFAKPTE
jgi:hypothetical protein